MFLKSPGWEVLAGGGTAPDLAWAVGSFGDDFGVGMERVSRGQPGGGGTEPCSRQRHMEASGAECRTPEGPIKAGSVEDVVEKRQGELRRVLPSTVLPLCFLLRTGDPEGSGGHWLSAALNEGVCTLCSP